MYSNDIFKTGVPLDVIKNIGLEISSIKKEGFNIHPKLKQIFQVFNKYFFKKINNLIN